MNGEAVATESVVAYKVGIFYASVCAAEDVSRGRIEAVVNARYPTGGVGSWQLSKDATFAGGEPNPCPCNTGPGRCHWLLEC